MTALTIAICTFRRPHLSKTLESLAAIKSPSNVSVHVLVVDNDDTPSAHGLVESSSLPFPVRYLHAPGANISIARNAALSATSTRYLVFIDDDEMVRPEWLRALWDTREEAQCDVVLGPVNAVTSEATRAWIRNGGFHDTRPAYVGNKIVTGYCCNVLMDLQAPAIAKRQFRLDLGRSGGEDTEFFFAATRDGATIGYSPEAAIDETLPQSRQSLRWLQQRRYRSGQTHALLLREYTNHGRTLEIVRASLKAGLCGIGCLATLWSSVRWRKWYLRGALHVGVIAGLLGQASVAIYGGASNQQ